MNRKNDNALAIFAKAPRVGYVKTRLQPEFTPQQAVLLYRAMVEDTLYHFQNVGFCDVIIYFSPENAGDEMKIWLGDRFKYFPQYGKNIGEKMYNAITEMLNQKYKKVLLAGSDIPTLDNNTIIKALSSLENFDVVLGPCSDGGYYLIGTKKLHPELFQEITWSSNLVFEQTLQKAQKAKLKIKQLEVLSDIDTYSDIKELWDYLNKVNKKDVSSYKAKTYGVLKKILILNVG